mgnify:CR=1 FL=1
MTVSISEFMTSHPHSIGVAQPLAVAERMMKEHHIRHLPVLNGGKIVGILSDRDAELSRRFGTKEKALTVEDAMMPDPYVAAPNEPLRTVARVMAEHKFGCAVVAEGTQIKGVFTTVDALNALSELLKNDADPRSGTGRRTNFERPG